ncbi:MAG TPA: HD domain-containing protein [Mycobacteriales bacterium]|jgi:putative hydrolase of HD superfamily|nr:HD domain-containing protein [Mycobacteriales bacterium]
MSESLLTDVRPLPEAITGRVRQQLNFIVECDRMKDIIRRSPLATSERRENDAEHSWHLALMAILLAEYSDEPVDLGHTVMLVVIHDLIEIYAGDTPLYDNAGRVDQAEREMAAAERLFALLPADQAVGMRALWDEFEACKTPEARFAKAMDRLEPQLLNWMAGGGTWQTPGVTGADVRARKYAIADASATLESVSGAIIDEAEKRGYIRS